ncbi:hypothetical protein BH11MYX4_BH11MYX4_69810 [soil metagenome]
MAMGWLKGLVAPAAFPDGAQQQGMPQGGPPMGGGPSPYGVQPGMGQPGMGQPGMGQPGMAPPPPGGPAPYDTSGLNSPMQWSTGTKTQGSAQGGLSSPHVAAGDGAGGAGSLEACCAQLQHAVDSLALFARTLLTMLEESKIVTREQFDATKQRLDMLDGKLDDR